MKKETLAGSLLLPASLVLWCQTTDVQADEHTDTTILQSTENPHTLLETSAAEVTSNTTEPARQPRHNFQMAATNNGVAPITMAATNNGSLIEDLSPVTIAVARKSESDYELTLSGVTAETNHLVLPIWSEVGGQDNLSWYQAIKTADGSYKVGVSLETHHGATGRYHTIIYGKATTGHLLTLAKSSFTIGTAVQDIQVQLDKIANNQYHLTLSSTPSSVDSLTVLVSQGTFSHTYTATKQNNGSYTTQIDLAHHRYHNGHYDIALYEGERQLPITATGFDIRDAVKPDIGLKVIDHQPNKGLLTLEFDEGEMTRQATSAKVAVWSEPHQANLHWYDVPHISGKTHLTINQAKHGRKIGDYHLHVYTTYDDGQVIGSNLGTYRLSATYPKPTSSASQGDYTAINQVIFLDAGHGGTDPGAVYYGVTEKSLNLSIQKLVKQKLEAAGYTVLTARSGDQSLGLVERSQIANASSADLFVSIHFNAATSSHINGIETYWYQYYPDYQPSINPIYHNHPERLERSHYLANAIQMGTVSQTGASNNGIHRRTFAVLRETTAPAVLVELGYMSHPSESQRLSNPAYQEKLANGIVSGILSYYQNYQTV